MPENPQRVGPVGAGSAGVAIGSLGLLTIVAYGTWYYGFGVLLDPIHDTEGWSRGALGAVFGAAIFVNGVGAAIGGRLLDAAGPRRTFLLASGALPLAVAYSLLAGVATGASSPLQAIYTAELIERRDLGLLLGVQQALYGIAGACGPIIVGVLLALTDSWVPAVALTALGFGAAAAILARTAPVPANG